MAQNLRRTVSSASPTRTSEVVRRLREDLLSSQLAPGEALRLTPLRARYNSGPTPLREALFQLAAEGLVTVEDQRGFRAAGVSLEELHDLTTQRVFVESQGLRLAIANGDLNWESRVMAAHHRLAGTPMLEGNGMTLASTWTALHRDFHRVLLDACGSPWLLRMRDTLSDQAERYRRWSVRQDQDRDVAGEHRILTEATLGRSADLAVSRLADHYWQTARLCQLAPATESAD